MIIDTDYQRSACARSNARRIGRRSLRMYTFSCRRLPARARRRPPLRLSIHPLHVLRSPVLPPLRFRAAPEIVGTFVAAVRRILRPAIRSGVSREFVVKSSRSRAGTETIASVERSGRERRATGRSQFEALILPGLFRPGFAMLLQGSRSAFGRFRPKLRYLASLAYTESRSCARRTASPSRRLRDLVQGTRSRVPNYDAELDAGAH